jgi:hypothetical protein
MTTMLSRRRVVHAVTGLALSVLPLRIARALERIKIRDLYETQAEFSEQAKALAGETIEIPGFMAPPLKADAGFFVLTKMPMAVCPFCETAADWPSDIVLVLLAEDQEWVPFNRPIVARGRLELGVEVDPETGFVSKVRLADGSFTAG